NGITSVNAGPVSKVRAVLRQNAGSQRPEALLKSECGPHGLRRVVRLIEWHVVERHDGVADVLVNRATVLEHCVGHDREILAEEGRSEEHTSELQSRFDLVC